MLTLLSGDFSRSLYRLRLKFVQTTRVVLQKVLRTYKFKYAHSSS